MARPDSRFDLDISRFIPDFVDRERCDRLIEELNLYRQAGLIFVAPDNSLQSLRESALGQGKQLLLPTWGMRRGMVLLDGNAIHVASHPLAATLDGMERFARPLDLDGLRSLGRVDMMVTGAVAVTEEGVHIDSGTGMFCFEWMLLVHLGLVDAHTPVVASVHDCQVVAALVAPSDNDAIVDLIATPDRLLSCAGRPKPPALRLGAVSRHLTKTVPYLTQLFTNSGADSQLVRRRR